jgi:PST family polysaccharide transporter
MPILGRLRPYPEAYRDTYLAFLTRLNLLVIPMAIMIALCSGVALDALWGPEWATAADILQCMAPMAATYAYGYGIADLFVTQNRSRELRILGLIEMLVRVSAVSIGVCISAHWAALAFSWATVAVVILRVLVAGRKGPVTIADHIRAALPSLPPCLGTAVGCAIGLFVSSRNAFDSMQSTLIAVGLGCAFGGSAAIALTISRREIISLVKLFRIRRRGSAITSSSRAD